ncbi:MAG: rRNA maturation RNase YbeY [Steroidobacteraceae bacterium]
MARGTDVVSGRGRRGSNAAAGTGDGAVVVEVQRAVRSWAPSARRIAGWVQAALGRRGAGAAVAVRLVGAAEGRRLNRSWRRKDYATNVLSFPAVAGPVTTDTVARPLGDLVICSPVLAREAREQGKTRLAHWAHLVVHGSLHLVGFEHERDADARRMERRERRVLADLGFPDPYAPAPRRRATPRRDI